MSGAAAKPENLEAEPRPRGRRSLVLFLPLALFLVVGIFLGVGLTRDPGTLPSALIGKPAPTFALPPLAGRDDHGLARSDLGGKPMLVNVFASWCVPCRIEHPVVARLVERGVIVDGINQRDQPENASAWLKELGDPYRHVGVDRDGRTSIEWGVYGVPETFVLDRDGRIVHRHVGPLQPRDVEETIVPLLERLR